MGRAAARTDELANTGTRTDELRPGLCSMPPPCVLPVHCTLCPSPFLVWAVSGVLRALTDQIRNSVLPYREEARFTRVNLPCGRQQGGRHTGVCHGPRREADGFRETRQGAVGPGAQQTMGRLTAK